MGDAPPRQLASSGGDRLKAAARIRAELLDGRTVHRVLHAEAPLALRRVDDVIYVVSAAAHPVGGDDLTVRIEVGAGARVAVRSVAAMLVWPGPAGERSRLRFDVEVDAGGRLDVAPEPTVPVRGCDHSSEVVARLAPGAALRWRDDVALGRSGEHPGRLESTLRIEREGRVLFASGTRVGGDVVAWSGPAVTAGRRRLCTEVLVGQGWCDGGTGEVVDGAGALAAIHTPADGVTVVSRLWGNQPAA